MGLLPSIGSVLAATCPAGGDRLPLASRIADPRNLTSGRTFLGPDHHPAYAGGGGHRSDGNPLVRRRPGALRTTGHTSSPPARPRRRPGQPLSTAPSGTRPASRQRHSASSSLRARATTMIRLIRPVRPPPRRTNQALSRLSG